MVGKVLYRNTLAWGGKIYKIAAERNDRDLTPAVDAELVDEGGLVAGRCTYVASREFAGYHELCRKDTFKLVSLVFQRLRSGDAEKVLTPEQASGTQLPVWFALNGPS